MLVKIAYSARNSARILLGCPLGTYLFLKMEAGSLGLTPNSLCKAKSLHHFDIISVEMVNILLGSYKKGGANKCIFQFFLLMLRISLEILIFRYSAQILLENALFCRQNARPKNRLFCSKFCRQNLSKPTMQSFLRDSYYFLPTFLSHCFAPQSSQPITIQYNATLFGNAG